MAALIRILGSMSVLALGGSLLGACGGAFDSGGSCEHDGDTYADGESFPVGDGCNTCSCDDRDVICTRAVCSSTCVHEGSDYQMGDTFPAGDGCNTCSCGEGGVVACTRAACGSCQDIFEEYQTAIDAAKVCDPQASAQCSELITEGLACGCEVFVNPDNVESIVAAEEAQERYTAFSCGADVLCGACAEPVSAYCSAAGRCETVRHTGASIGCRVGGVVYENGASGIDDPFSCNTCECVDGQLACTEINCPEDCPPDSVPGTQCVQCGPVDECEVLEHACLPVCNDTCEQGACIEGVCRMLCG